MQTHLDLRVRHIDRPVREAERKGVLHHPKRLWIAIVRRATYDKDGIFKDPNWPHLWS
jgi:hypothetical protein